MVLRSTFLRRETAGAIGLALMVVIPATAAPTLEFSSYLGTPGFDSGLALVATPDGGFYVAGSTQGAGLPATPDAYQPEFHVGTDPAAFDGFVARIGADNQVLALTYFG
ncbi:MAG: hypothetical protein AAF533_25360, partial [Acidobacteriota bacterium]